MPFGFGGWSLQFYALRCGTPATRDRRALEVVLKKAPEVAPPLLHNVRSSVPGTLTDGMDTLVIDSAAMYILIFIIII